MDKHLAQLSIADLTQRVLQFRNARDWQQFHSLPQMLLALFTEVAELAENFQWLSEQEIKQRLEADQSEVADELADVLYWVLLIAQDLKIDLQQAFLHKMSKNSEKYPEDLAKGKNKKYSEYA